MNALSNNSPIKKTVILYRHPRGRIALAQQGEKYLVIYGYCPAAEVPQGYTYSSVVILDNPLKAWTAYHDAVDADVRRRIGDMLEAQGKNRWTGIYSKSEDA